jgi:polycomb protein EED
MMQPHSEFPSLRTSLRLGGKDANETAAWYDVKFYPYTPPGVDPVFAVVGGCDTVICRCVLQKETSIEILQWFKDEDKAVVLNSLEWSQAENGDPLVCVSGNRPQIKVLNVKTGELVMILSGHGDAVNDLAVSPVNPRILASASTDGTVRIWSLDPAHKKQPTAAIFFGEGGHKETVLSLGFHRTGKYLLSGGMDTIVNLWVMPDPPEKLAGTDKPYKIPYPHFSTTDIHTDFVDCVRFYNDLIISRAAKENSLLLWRIDGFDSDRPAPPYTAAPIPRPHIINLSNPNPPKYVHTNTHSAWGGCFTRLLKFDQPQSSYFYIRFGLFHDSGKHPILAAGNEKSKLFFWDLQRVEEMQPEGRFKVPDKKKPDKSKDEPRDKPPPGLAVPVRPHRESSLASNVSYATSAGSGSTAAARRKNANKEKDHSLGDPFHGLPAHKGIVVPKYTFAMRQVAWSCGGELCIAVGDNSVISIFRRWDKGFPE